MQKTQGQTIMQPHQTLDEKNTFFYWVTKHRSPFMPLLLWVLEILFITLTDFAQIQTGIGDYPDMDKSSDVVILYSLLFNAVAVTSNLGGPYNPTGWCMFSNAVNAVMGLLFYGVSIAKIVNVTQDMLLKDISRRINLMMNENDWDALMDALRDRANRLKLDTSPDSDAGKMFIFRELISYVEKLLQQRPVGYQEESINIYELEAILRYSLEGIEACQTTLSRPAYEFHRHSLYAVLREYRNSLMHADSPFLRDEFIHSYFLAIEKNCRGDS